MFYVFKSSDEERTSPQVPVVTEEVPGAPAESAQPVPKQRSRRISLGLQIHPPSGELLSMQKLKHPAISIIKDGEYNNTAEKI